MTKFLAQSTDSLQTSLHEDQSTNSSNNVHKKNISSINTEVSSSHQRQLENKIEEIKDRPESYSSERRESINVYSHNTNQNFNECKKKIVHSTDDNPPNSDNVLHTFVTGGRASLPTVNTSTNVSQAANSIDNPHKTESKEDRALSNSLLSVCGAAAAACGTLVSMPCDVARTRMVAQSTAQVCINLYISLFGRKSSILLVEDLYATL